jgi:hypothetical protein
MVAHYVMVESWIDVVNKNTPSPKSPQIGGINNFQMGGLLLFKPDL